MKVRKNKLLKLFSLYEALWLKFSYFMWMCIITIEFFQIVIFLILLTKKAQELIYSKLVDGHGRVVKASKIEDLEKGIDYYFEYEKNNEIKKIQFKKGLEN